MNHYAIEVICRQGYCLQHAGAENAAVFFELALVVGAFDTILRNHVAEGCAI